MNNSNLNAKFIRSYRSAKGNTVFVYAVTGSEKDIESYKQAQGDNFREDENTKTPLFFTTRFFGNGGKLIVTAKGKVVPDMSAFEQAASLAAQFGGNFGQELARQAAGSLLGTAPQAPVPATVDVIAE